MQKIMSFIGKVMSLVFAAIVIGFTAYLTWLLAARLVPDNTILQFMTIALFDGGALTWFVLFITQAKGTAQWGIAGIGFAIGLLGAVIMAAGELILGQRLVALNDPTTLGWVLIATVIVAALAHATLIYGFHFTDPAVMNRIENEQKVSEVIQKAYTDARSEIDRRAESMGEDVAKSLIYQAEAQLKSAALPHLRHATRIIEATAKDMPEELPAPEPIITPPPAINPTRGKIPPK